MAELNVQALLKSAAEAGVQRDLLPEGPNNFIVQAKSIGKPNQNGNVSFGLLVKIVGGPDNGLAAWVNQNIGENNPIGNGIFFSMLEDFGLTSDYYGAEGVGLEQIANALLNREFHATVEHRQWKQREQDKGKPARVTNDLKHITLGHAEAAAPVATAPVPEVAAAPAATVPAPPVPAPTPVTVPVPTPAPMSVPEAVATAEEPF